jgi:hypothetical protein
MTNEEKVQKYKEEIEAVFYTEKAINLLNSYDEYLKNGEKQGVRILQELMLKNKEYWVKFTIEEPSVLNMFLRYWVLEGQSIAGVKGQILDINVINKNELKGEIIKMIEEL